MAHLGDRMAPHAGEIAVFGFYTLSGYLITRVVTTRYGGGDDGLKRFALNRALRLYPAYFALLFFSIALIPFIAETAVRLNPVLAMPESAGAWPAQFAIFGLLKVTELGGLEQRLVPPAWSLNMELLFYTIIALGAAGSRLRAHAWLAVSLLFWGYLLALDEKHVAYQSMLGPSLPFACEAVLHYHAKAVERLVARAPAPLAIAAALGYGLYAYMTYQVSGRVSGTQALFLSVPVALVAISACAFHPAIRDSRFLAPSDQLLGDLSYPAFLCHWHVAAALMAAFPEALPGKGPALVFASFPLIILLSVAVVFLVERPVERVRARVRAAAIAASGDRV